MVLGVVRKYDTTSTTSQIGRFRECRQISWRDAGIAENDAGNDGVVVGEAAEQMIVSGTVLKNYSTEVQYGVKHYYVVLYRGYQWLCEQATYRISCHVEVEEP